MRLSPRDFSGYQFSFRFFLRLALVSFLCFLGPLLVSKQFDPAIGILACIVAFPLWWYHFGLPRFNEQGSGFFSARFCMFGYIMMAASVVLTVLEYFGIIQEGRPIPFLRQLSPYFRVAVMVCFIAFCIYEFTGRKRPKGDA